MASQKTQREGEDVWRYIEGYQKHFDQIAQTLLSETEWEKGRNDHEDRRA